MIFLSDAQYSDVVTRVFAYRDGEYMHYMYSIGKRNQDFDKYYLLTILSDNNIIIKDINNPIETLSTINNNIHEVAKTSVEFAQFLKYLSLAQIDINSNVKIDDIDSIIAREEQYMYGKKTRY